MAARKVVAENLGHYPFCSIDAALGEAPFHLCELELCGLGCLKFAGCVEVVDFDACLLSAMLVSSSIYPFRFQSGRFLKGQWAAYLGEKVGNPSDAPRTTDSKSWRQPVTLPSESREHLGLKFSAHTCNLGDAAACKLDADNVGVFAERAEHLRVDVETGCDAGEVVYHDGEGAGVCELYVVCQPFFSPQYVLHFSSMSHTL